ncbi:DUF4097 family beta strand repeat-containing protein [Streptomyces sp. NPDC102360]|uniref:DUF4097 family beta strand repeat-containing protein n=1 Tax=Streptomyces sp. NPDC102360 TaxID=3366160 RepID=UPI0038196481
MNQRIPNTTAVPARRGTRAARAAVLCVTLAATGTLLTACGGSADEEKSAGGSYTVGGKVTALSVTTPGGDIEVIAGDGDGIKVTEKIRYTGEKPKTEHTTSGGTLTLTPGDGCGPAGGPGSCKVSYRVEVPRAVSAALDSSGGDVTVTGLAGSIAVEAGGGKVRADDVAAKSLRVSAKGGSVQAGFTSAPSNVDVDTKAGNVTVRVPNEAYAVQVSAKGGSEKVGVRTDPASNHKISLTTDGGSVQLAAAS